MPRKLPSRPPSGPDDSTAWLVILERIESQNQMTYEAVNARADALESQLHEVDRESRTRDADLASAIRGMKTDIGRLDSKVDNLDAKVDSLDTRVGHLEAKVDDLDVKVEKIDARLQGVETKIDLLVPLESRVTALERRPA